MINQALRMSEFPARVTDAVEKIRLATLDATNDLDPFEGHMVATLTAGLLAVTTARALCIANEAIAAEDAEQAS